MLWVSGDISRARFEIRSLHLRSTAKYCMDALIITIILERIKLPLKIGCVAKRTAAVGQPIQCVVFSPSANMWKADEAGRKSPAVMRASIGSWRRERNTGSRAR